MEINNFLLSRPDFLSHLRALFAIARKDWKQYWRYPLNAVSQIFQPIIWLTPVYFMGKAFSVNGQAQGFAQYSGTADFMSFILLGTVLTNFINSVFWGMGYSLKEDMDAGVMESNWLTPEGIPGRPWFQHLLYAARYTYAHLELPGLTEAAEKGDWKTAQAQVALLEAAVEKNTELLRQAKADIDKSVTTSTPPRQASETLLH